MSDDDDDDDDNVVPSSDRGKEEHRVAHRAHESSGKEKSMYKEETRAHPGAPVRSLARSFIRSLASERTSIHTRGERTERASERARSL